MCRFSWEDRWGPKWGRKKKKKKKFRGLSPNFTQKIVELGVQDHITKDGGDPFSQGEDNGRKKNLQKWIPEPIY